MIDIKQMLLSKSKYPLKCPYPMTPIGICIHNTANSASALNEIKYMISNDSSTSFHFAVDEKEVIQGLPLNRNGFHAGDGRNGKGNRQTIGIEICRSTSKDEELFEQAEKNTAKLVAYLLQKYNWSISQIYKHEDFANKRCPHKTLDKGWGRFIQMVITELNNIYDKTEEQETVKYYQKLEEIPTSYKPTISKMISNGIIKGDENGNLNLSEDMCRMLVFMDRFVNK